MSLFTVAQVLGPCTPVGDLEGAPGLDLAPAWGWPSPAVAAMWGVKQHRFSPLSLPFLSDSNFQIK